MTSDGYAVDVKGELVDGERVWTFRATHEGVPVVEAPETFKRREYAAKAGWDEVELLRKDGKWQSVPKPAAMPPTPSPWGTSTSDPWSTSP